MVQYWQIRLTTNLSQQEKSALAWLEGMVDLALDKAVLSGPKVDLPRSLSLMRQVRYSIREF